MKTILFGLLSTICLAVPVEIKVLQNAEEFRALVAQSERPVIVQFSAEWCQPCHLLLEKFETVALEYDESQLSIAIVDADINRELRSYLIGNSYPTVRAFHHGEEIPRGSFNGNQSLEFVSAFVNAVSREP